MKFAFSTKNVASGSFLELCNTAARYEFDAIEIFDAEASRKNHPDSILHSRYLSGAKRKLINRNLSVCAVSYPESVNSSTNNETLGRYVEYAARVRANLCVTLGCDDAEQLQLVLGDAIKKSETLGVKILIESVGVFSNTEKILDIINFFHSASLGVVWDTRATFFDGNETPDDTIKTLGAYINYVRLGDRKDGNDRIIGSGMLPVDQVINALRSLNFDGFVECSFGGEIAEPDIVLTHFKTYMARLLAAENKPQEIYYNRAKTGVHPWKKYDVVDLTFSQVLDTMVEHYPDQYAFKYTTLDYTRTYSQFRDDVDAVAASLIALGVEKGHHVAIWATNIPQWFLTFWATVKIGAVLVTVNTAYKIHEIEYLLRQSDTHTLVMIEDCKDSNYKECIEQLCPELKEKQKAQPLYSKKLPFLRNVVTVGFELDGCYEWEEMMQLSASVPKSEVSRRAAEVRADDVCNMQYTSGTTGFPKGVMLTHRNIVNNGKIIGDRMDISTADRMMIQVPMFHCFGMVLSMTNMMTHGGTICPMPYFSPKSSLACINDEKITCFNGVPTMFIAMFSHADFAKTDFSHIRTGIMAGANCPPELMRRAAEEMNMREIISVYGQTEASPGCTMGEVNEDLWHRTETVGSAFPGVECKIIDPETGEDLPDGENGEFVARGFNIMKGYYKMPKATDETIDSDGWLHSGDICCRLPDGYYKVTGRLKDMIIRGGENLYPREIEEFYLTHEKVSDVQVVGVPDQRYGEECCAWIILKKGETATEDDMRIYGEEHMAKHKVPRYFIITDSFPMNAAGKILKYKMREQSVEMLGL